MIFYGVLKQLTAKWKIDETASIQNELLTGEQDIKSKKVVTELYNLSREIEKNNKLKNVFLNNKPDEIVKEIITNREFIKIKSRFDLYLNPHI